MYITKHGCARFRLIKLIIREAGRDKLSNLFKKA